ncbi:hypothetical protein HRbin23_00583 [bacterium HR23]|nr:hypothetical protein HRbin23_00583 [bacterium HR23]
MVVTPRLYYDLSPQGLAFYAHSSDPSGRGPVLVLLVGPGNVLEAPPEKAVSIRPGVLSVACADGWVVILDVAEGTARRSGPGGEEVYNGSLEEGNEGRGWVPVR